MPVHYPETNSDAILSNVSKGEMRRAEKHDRELVDKTLEGSERAFRSLVERYHALVFSVVRGVMGRCDEVEDVIQEIFIKIYRNLSGYRGDASLSTWIYRISRNEAINAVSRFRLETEPLDESVGRVGREARPDECLDRTEAKHRLEELLATLDERYRIAIELRYMGEKSYAEIAEIMEIPIGTVKTYLFRAKAAMKRRLSVIRSRGESI